MSEDDRDASMIQLIDEEVGKGGTARPSLAALDVKRMGLDQP